MKRNKKIVGTIVFFFVSLIIYLFPYTSVLAQEKEFTATFSIHTCALENRSMSIGMKYFADAVTKKTNGRIKFNEYYSGVLCPGERESYEEVKAGNIDIICVAASPMASFVPEVGILDLNFLFKDYEHAHKVLWGEIGDEFLKDMEKAGFKGLGWYEDGFAYLSTSGKPVRHPEDVKGMRIRVMESPVLLYTWRDVLGSDAFPLSWAELYMALQRGLAEGQMNNVVTIVDHNFFEVQDYMNKVLPLYQAAPLVMDLDKFNALPEDIQTLFVETAHEVAPAAWDHYAAIIAEYEQKCRDKKLIEIIDDIDMKEWMDAAAPAIKYFAIKNGWTERIEAIQNLAK